MPIDLARLEIGRRYTRPQLAERWGYASYRAIARGVVTPAEGNVIVLFVTREKQNALPQYQDLISGDHLYWEGEKAHGSDRRIADAHRTGEEIHLFYREIHHSPFQYRGPIQLLRFRPFTDKPSEFKFRLEHDLGPADDIATHSRELEPLADTEKEMVVKARVGQGRFRDDLLGYWSGCAVTGVRLAELLKASHIKPWRLSTNAERLDAFNGLLLLPHYDHLFDRGFITFDDRGLIQISPAIAAIGPGRLGISRDARLRQITQAHLPFLEFHNHEVFVDRMDAPGH